MFETFDLLRKVCSVPVRAWYVEEIQMYDYRHMTPEQRKRVLIKRQSRGFPWHSPPHFTGEKNTFLITGVCFDHRPILDSPERLTEFSEALVGGVKRVIGVSVEAWVVQPNHYHLLIIGGFFYAYNNF